MAIREQRNLQVHLAVSVCVIVAGVSFQLSKIEWMVLCLTIGVVIAAELFNSAIEGLVDLVSPERNPLAGKVKDVAAGAVLVTAAMAVAIGALVFGKHVLAAFR